MEEEKKGEGRRGRWVGKNEVEEGEEEREE